MGGLHHAFFFRSNVFLALLGCFSTAAFAGTQTTEDLFLSPDAPSSQEASTLLHSVDLAEFEQVDLAELKQQLLDLGLDESEVEIALVSEDGELLHMMRGEAWVVAVQVVAVLWIAAGIYAFIKPLH